MYYIIVFLVCLSRQTDRQTDRQTSGKMLNVLGRHVLGRHVLGRDRLPIWDHVCQMRYIGAIIIELQTKEKIFLYVA